MEDKRADISQIRKYLNGELDAKAMHRLEREAQDDPFLMDAIEGYQQAGGIEETSLDLLGKRLAMRTGKQKRRIIPWTVTAIAASVLGFLIVVGLLYNRTDKTQLPQQTAAITPHVKTADTIAPPPLPTVPVITQTDKNIAALKPAKPPIGPVISSPDFEADKAPAVIAADAAQKDTTALEDMIMAGVVKQRDSANTPLVIAVKKQSYTQTLQGKTKGVMTTQAPSKQRDNSYYLGGTNPVEGPKTLAEAQMRPKVEIAPASSTSYGYAGKAYSNYAAKSPATVTNGNDSIASRFLTIADTVAAPRPVAGWQAFDAYLHSTAVLPAGAKPGVVGLQFVVDASGKVSAIRVTKSAGTAADEKAVSIIRNGPAWTGGGSSRFVNIEVKFTAKP